MHSYKVSVITGKVKNIKIGERSQSSLSRMFFSTKESIKYLSIDDEIVEVRTKGEMFIEDGDEVAVAGKREASIFIALAYKNISKNKNGGVRFRNNWLLALLRLLVVVLFVASLYYLALSTHEFLTYLLMLLNIVMLMYITYDPYLVYKAHKMVKNR